MKQNAVKSLYQLNPTARCRPSPASLVRATAMRATRNVVSLTTNYVTVVKPKQCHISSTRVQLDGELLRLHEADEAANDIWLLAYDNNNNQHRNLMFHQKT